MVFVRGVFCVCLVAVVVSWVFSRELWVHGGRNRDCGSARIMAFVVLVRPLEGIALVRGPRGTAVGSHAVRGAYRGFHGVSACWDGWWGLLVPGSSGAPVARVLLACVVFLCARRSSGSWPVARSRGVSASSLGTYGWAPLVLPGSAGVVRALWSFLGVVHIYALLRVYTPCAGIILCGSVHVYALVARVGALRGGCGRRSTGMSSRCGCQWGGVVRPRLVRGGSAVVGRGGGRGVWPFPRSVGLTGLVGPLSFHVRWWMYRIVVGPFWLGEWCGSGFGRCLRGDRWHD